MVSPIQEYLEDLHRRIAPLADGAPASYIPELAKIDADGFGICLVTLDGMAYTVGDSDRRFTIQSISKPFVYATALADRGQEFVSSKVGVEPSGDAFNSISLDPKTGAPMNPMINAGAIASTSLVSGGTADAQWARITESLGTFMGREVDVDEAVYRSESETGFRNRAIAWMLKNFGVIDQDDPMPPLENYFRQCSVRVDCTDLAFMAATLANGGVHPTTGQRALPGEHVARVLSVMATCGMYDYAGSWLYEVGMPAKSGVGGGILAVLPGRFGIGIYSPPLDAKGNSVRGIEVCKQLSRDFNLNVFCHPAQPRMALSRVYTGAEAPSKRQFSGETRELVNAQAGRIKTLCLHGYLAVDGIEYVIRKMHELADDADSFILDLHQATGLSEPAARLLERTRAGLAERNIAVVFSRLHERPGLTGPLARAATGGHGFLSFEDNDLAAEWCENRLLGNAMEPLQCDGALAASPLFEGVPAELVARVEAVTRRNLYAQGEPILVSGQENDRRIFFIESGHVSVLVPLKKGGHQRVVSMGPGANFGEMILLGGKMRSASVYADTEVRCRVLDADDVDRLSEADPALKIALLENLAKDLAVKLRRATQWIAALA